MDDHRDIYTKPEAKPQKPEELPAYEHTPEALRASARRRTTISLVIMVALLIAAAIYFYKQEGSSKLNPLLEKLRGADVPTAETARTSATNLPGLAGLAADYAIGHGETPPPNLPPTKVAEAMGYIRMANQYLRQFDLDGAERSVKETLAIWPGMNAGQRLLGVVYIYRGQFDQAILILERALQADPFSAETLNNLAIAYMQKGQVEKAEDLLLTAAQINPASFSTQVNLGLLYILWARYDQAADHLESARQLMPDNPTVRNNLGVALLRIGRFEEARQNFQYLIQTIPTRVETYFNMAIVNAIEDRQEDALDWLRQALQHCTPAEAQRHMMDSDLDGLRGLPEFQRMMKELSAPITPVPGLIPDAS